MSRQKHGNNPKKQSAVSISQEENALVQQRLADYRQITAALVRSQHPAQVENALEPITSLPESAQVVLLKALAKENTTEAADVLLAINTFAPLKEVRKEAHRSLIRLEASRRYPQWTPPQSPTPAIEETTTTGPRRFWKGQYTDSRAMGELQLMLFWEQGEDFKEVRMFGFLLEFWQDGIKDFFTEVSSKRQIEKRMENLRSQLGGIKLISCDFAEGRRLVEEALAVNKERGTRPHPDYTRNLPLIRRLLLDATSQGSREADDVEEREDQSPFLSSDQGKSFFEQLMDFMLNPEETVAGYLDSWLRGDYEAAYAALASDSPLREGLSAREWTGRRRAWAERAQPSQGRSEIAYKREEEEIFEEDEEENVVSSEPTEDTAPAEVEAFWSLVLTDSDASSELKELPRATAVYKATGRHWFWTKYTLVREGNEWRIHSMIDAGAEALQLPSEALQQQLTEIATLAAEQLNLVEAEIDDEDLDEGENEDTDEIDKEEEDEEDLEDLEFDELAERFEEMMWITTRAMHYTDALIAQSPDDATLYEMGYDQASAIQENERAAAYIELQAERFPEQRGEALRKLAIAQINIARTYEENGDEERAMQFIVEAEKMLRDSLMVDSAPMSNILLAETLLIQNKQLDEAERLLQEVLKQENIYEKEITLAEAALGKLVQGKRDYASALSHYQRAAEISPDFPGIWFSVGFMQRQLGQLEEAEESYRRSIDESPAETGAYVELAAIYSDRGEYNEAEELLDEGLEINPEAADLLAAMALVFINKGEMRQAKEYLDEAEDIDDEHELVQVVRQYYDATQARLKQERQQFKQQQRKSRRPKRK